jgi:type VI secretion system protein ImpC
MANDAQADGAQAALQEQEGSLLDQILSEARFEPDKEGYEMARQGISAFIADILEGKRVVDRVDQSVVDAMIVDLDRRLSAQVNEILHNESFQKIESAWRSLYNMVESFDFRENIRLEVLNCNKEELLEDFEDTIDVTKSVLYQNIYKAEYGVYGGEPYGLVVGNWEFGPGTQDLALLNKVASVSAMSHAPFITNAGAEFFGVDDFRDLEKMKDLSSVFQGPQYAKWRAFRENEDSRYVGMCVPKMLLREPYGAGTIPAKTFSFEEDVVGHNDRYLWGYVSTALACRVADSFAKFRWCPNVIGPTSGGAVENLPLHQYEQGGEIQTKVPTEVQIDDRREFELAEQGFISLVFQKRSNSAAFFSANSVQKPKSFPDTPEGRAAQTNYTLGTRLPYMFVITRLAHYLKVMQRNQIGSFKDRSDLQRELDNWLRQYVSEMENPHPSVRARRPLKAAQVLVEDVEGEPGWYRCSIKVQPHMKYEGASFELSLVGKLDKQ